MGPGPNFVLLFMSLRRKRGHVKWGLAPIFKDLPTICRSNFFYLDNVFLIGKVLPYIDYFSGGGYETL